MELKERIERVLSEILTDKYGEEYGVNITLRFASQDDQAQARAS